MKGKLTKTLAILMKKIKFLKDLQGKYLNILFNYVVYVLSCTETVLRFIILNIIKK